MDVAQLWADIEDHFVPAKRVWLAERVLYFHLLRRTRLAGKRRLTTSIGELAKYLSLCKTSARTALQRLDRAGAVRIKKRDRDGHHVEVRLPREIAGCVRTASRRNGIALDLERCNQGRRNREAIFERERHRCFYCLKQLGTRSRTLDHVVPRAQGGGDSYRNVVACCMACNETKKTAAAEDFVRRLHRQDLLNRRELYRRMAALRALQKGRLKPALTLRGRPL